MTKLDYSQLQAYAALTNRIEDTHSGIEATMHGLYPDNSETDNLAESLDQAAELVRVVTDLHAEIRVLFDAEQRRASMEECPVCHCTGGRHDTYCPKQAGAFPLADDYHRHSVDCARHAQDVPCSKDCEARRAAADRIDGGAAPLRPASHTEGYKGERPVQPPRDSYGDVIL